MIILLLESALQFNVREERKISLSKILDLNRTGDGSDGKLIAPQLVFWSQRHGLALALFDSRGLVVSLEITVALYQNESFCVSLSSFDRCRSFAI